MKFLEKTINILLKIVKELSNSEIADMLLADKFELSDIIHLLSIKRAKSIANISNKKFKY
jgi:hypothetical protein